jgi:hypothetical protein
MMKSRRLAPNVARTHRWCSAGLVPTIFYYAGGPPPGWATTNIPIFVFSSRPLCTLEVRKKFG